jgi:penicillin-binding protein 1A
MFPNRGFNTEPIYLNRIEDRNGNVLQNFEAETKQVISEVDAYTMYRMMQGVVDFGTGHGMRDKFGIQSAMGGKTGTTNDNTDGWFIGYTPQLLAGAWVGCDDPFLRIRQTYGGNEMAMPEFAYFMQKVYADKTLGIDPKAEFEKPAELNNDPIYADQNFAAIAQHGQGSDTNEDQGNGDAGDYSAPTTDVPVESDFGAHSTEKPVAKPAEEKKIIGPVNVFAESKKDSIKKAEGKATEKKLKKVDPAQKENDGKSKKYLSRPVKPPTDY